MNKNCIVAQSGGPTAAINASLAGVVAAARDFGIYDKIYGAIHGIQGVLKKHFLDLSDKDDAFIQKLARTPAMYLGSCRFKLPDMKDDVSMYEEIFSIFEEMNIGAFFYIGGNDSMDTVAKLSQYMDSVGYEMRIMGVPKTIDNDLVGTDHTPGFGSAAKYIATTMEEIMRDTAVYTVKAVTIVEIMGRDAGWLTACAALPSLCTDIAPDLVYLPEVTFDYDEFFEDIAKALETHPNVVVAVSEGIHLSDGTYVGEGRNGNLDAFGHKQLSGTAKTLELAVKEKFGCKVRSIELNLPQRCASHIASKTDLDESVMIGKAAVKCASEGESGKMMTFVRTNSTNYAVYTESKDISGIANAVRRVPREFINKRGNNVTHECLEYIHPLILGETSPVFVGGIPKHFVIKR